MGLSVHLTIWVARWMGSLARIIPILLSHTFIFQVNETYRTWNLSLCKVISGREYDRSRERRDNRNGRSSKVYRREFSRDRTVSPGVREYMRRGQNCDDDYNPKKKYCSKCKESGHHPFNCQQFKEWRREPCRLCKGHHSERECAERREKILN